MGYMIKQLRIRKGISQKELAKLLDIDQTSISKYEKGQRNPTPENITKIAKALNAPETYLMDNYKIEEKTLMGNIKGLSPESMKKMNEYAEYLKFKEGKFGSTFSELIKKYPEYAFCDEIPNHFKTLGL